MDDLGFDLEKWWNLFLYGLALVLEVILSLFPGNGV